LVSRASSRPSFQYTSAPPCPSPLRVVPSAPCLSSSSQVYGEPVAILAGDALLSQSFEVSAPPWSGEPLQLRHPSARHRAPRRTTAENARNLSPIRARAHEHPSRERGAASERARASGAERRERAADEGARVRERRAARARRRLRNEALFFSLRRSLASPLSASSFARPRRLSLSLSLPSHAATPRLGFGRRVASTASLARSLALRSSCALLLRAHSTSRSSRPRRCRRSASSRCGGRDERRAAVLLLSAHSSSGPPSFASRPSRLPRARSRDRWICRSSLRWGQSPWGREGPSSRAAAQRLESDPTPRAPAAAARWWTAADRAMRSPGRARRVVYPTRYTPSRRVASRVTATTSRGMFDAMGFALQHR
jgi:hypothetical protein